MYTVATGLFFVALVDKGIRVRDGVLPTVGPRDGYSLAHFIGTVLYFLLQLDETLIQLKTEENIS